MGVVASRREQEQIAERFQGKGMNISDIYQEIEMDSYYVDTHQDVSFGGAVIHLHSHCFYELLCIRSACGVEYMIDAECVTIQPGDILFLPPGVLHRPLIPEKMPVPYVRDVLWLSQEFLEIMFHQGGFIQTSGKGLVLRTAGTKWEKLPELFHKGVKESEEEQRYWEVSVLGNTLTLMAQLRRFWTDQTDLPQTERKPQLLEKILAYVEEHYRERISLADVSAHCFVSESTICHTFQEKMGISFYRCLTQRRLLEAKKLMAGELSLESISKAVGFADYAAFYRAFKREYSISPRKFKELTQGSVRK